MTTEQLTRQGCQFYYRPVDRPNRHFKLSIADIYGLIVNPQHYGPLTAQYRALTSDKARKDFKRHQLDYVLFSGLFVERNDAGLLKHSHLLCTDLDHLGPNLPKVHQQLLSDPWLETALLFVSPSGAGLKWVVPIDLDVCSHRDWFYAIAHHLKEAYGLESDKSCVNESRACFLCHDPEAYINPAYNNQPTEQNLVNNIEYGKENL